MTHLWKDVLCWSDCILEAAWHTTRHTSTHATCTWRWHASILQTLFTKLIIDLALFCVIQNIIGLWYLLELFCSSVFIAFGSVLQSILIVGTLQLQISKAENKKDCNTGSGSISPDKQRLHTQLQWWRAYWVPFHGQLPIGCSNRNKI